MTQHALINDGRYYCDYSLATVRPLTTDNNALNLWGVR